MLKKAFFACIAVSGLAAASGEAATEKIYVSHRVATNPETGKRTPVIANPSGEVQIRYITTGIEISYVDGKGRVETMQVHAEYPPVPRNADGSIDRFNEMMAQVIFRAGKRLPGQLLHHVAVHERSIPEGAPEGYKAGHLILVFDKMGRVGFNPAYQLNDITLLTRDGELRLDLAIRNNLAMQIDGALRAEHQARAAVEGQRETETERAPAGVRYPMGFLTGKEAVPQTCAALFR